MTNHKGNGIKYKSCPVCNRKGYYKRFSHRAGPMEYCKYCKLMRLLTPVSEFFLT